MKVGIQAWGSEGDIRPLVALARRLCAAGHRVRLDVTPVDGVDYSRWAQVENLTLRVVPKQMTFSLAQLAVKADRFDPLQVSRELVEQAFFPYLNELYAAALDLCADSELVVWHYSCWYTKAAALATGVPEVSVQLFPGLVPTRFGAPGGLPNLGPLLNPALWWLAKLFLDLQFRKRPAAFFRAHGLPPVRHVLPELLFSNALNLHAASPALVPPEKDWGEAHVTCGQFVMPPEAEPWVPSAPLSEFLREGKPVLVSLGSMEHLAPRRARELVLASARASKLRVLVQTKREGEEGRMEEGREGDLYFLPRAPHDALLPHCAALVHHGGAGTSHTAVRGGVPSVVVPFIPEQAMWANVLRKAGVAGKPVPFWKAKPEALAARMREVVAADGWPRRAQELSARLKTEDGTGAAVALLERAALRRGP